MPAQAEEPVVPLRPDGRGGGGHDADWQEEAARPSHWDLMVENGDSLLTWELKALPEAVTGGQPLPWPARRLPDHRCVYLEYEGMLSGGRGQVDRVAGGAADVLTDLHGGWRCRLRSATLVADIALKISEVGDSATWLIYNWDWLR